MPVTRTQLRHALGVVTIAGQASATQTDSQAGRHLGLRSRVIGRLRVEAGILSEREAAAVLAETLLAPDEHGVATRSDSYVRSEMARYGIDRSISGVVHIRERAGISVCERTAGLGEALRTTRTCMGLTQREMGRRLGVSKSAISAWESGRSIPFRVVQQLGLSRSEVSQ